MAIAMCHYGLYPIYTVRLSPTQHTDIEPEPAAADLRRAVRQDVRGPPGRVLLLGAPGARFCKAQILLQNLIFDFETCPNYQKVT